MKINLIAIGTKMPAWVTAGYDEFVKRLPKDFTLHLIEINAEKRLKSSSIPALLEREGTRLLSVVPSNSYLIALDRQGISLNSQEFALNIQKYTAQYQQISFLIGGPEGLSTACLHAAKACWSLSFLTLPHSLVRVILAEQIYRAWSIITHHPYHR